MYFALPLWFSLVIMSFWGIIFVLSLVPLFKDSNYCALTLKSNFRISNNLLFIKFFCVKNDQNLNTGSFILELKG